MEKKFLVVANWKANNVIIADWIKKFTTLYIDLPESNNVEVALAAPYIHLLTVSTLLRINRSSPPFNLASQDLSQFPTGAYTGEIPAEILTNIVTFSLLGHSERRKFLGETNQKVEAKMTQAINAGITPIICAQTLEEIPTNIRNYPRDKFIIMYEPEEAISTDGNYHPESPEKVESTLDDWQKKLNLNCQFLYGGSVNSQNVRNYAQLPLVSGFVVGHASLEAEGFFSIIKQCLLPHSS